jgi:ABC-type nitrate/sulfonate/bicarbonate transport system substrate-binding protein
MAVVHGGSASRATNVHGGQIEGERRTPAITRSQGGLARAVSHACNVHLDRLRATFVAVCIATVTLLAGRASAAPVRVRVLVPERSNLQLLSYWVAAGAGYFDEEGAAVQTVAPQSPALAQEAFARGAAPIAVLPAPMILRLASEKAPIVVAANVLAGDPIDLIAPRATVEAHGLGRDRPLADRLRAMKGLKVGVAPGPVTRLEALFASQGLDAHDVEVVTVPGGEQNAALGEGKVDALYAHTPYLERALLDQGAVVVVDQAGGEVPALNGRMVHALVVRSELAQRRPALVASLVRGLRRGADLVRRDPAKAVAAVLRAVPGTDAAHVARLVELYAKALPASPRPSVDALAREIAFTPANSGVPNVDAKELARFVDPRFADMPRPSGGHVVHFEAKLAVALAGAVGLLAAALAVLLESRKSKGAVASDTSV